MNNKKGSMAIIIIIVIVIIAIIIAKVFSDGANSSREDALKYGKILLSEIKTCQNDGGDINACPGGDCLNIKVCTDPKHTIPWPKNPLPYGWELVTSTAKNSEIKDYKFTFTNTNPKLKTITCDVIDNDCK